MGDRARRLQELFEAAAELSAAARLEFLDGLAGADAELRAELRELLAAHDAPPGSLDRPLLDVGERERAFAAIAPVVAGFHVLEPIGAGSASTVYAATTADGGALVALKVLRMGLATDDLVRRFALEIEVLQRLDHPFVARILGSGCTAPEHGAHPYLVMELVDGVPLQQHAAGEFEPRARVRLLLEIAEAVQHAHARGVIHRDLKPANVLVDRAGHPRVIDFGIARLTAADREASSIHTRQGALLGTLAYLSPEQAAGDSDAVDARSDLYAVGLIGYELLAGRRARDVSLLPLREALRRIAEDEAPRLLHARRDLPPELDVVLARALAREPDARYQSASELAADLRRVLAGEPIAAHPERLWRRLTRFARRHRFGVAAAALVLAALVAGAIGTGLAYGRSVREAERSARVTAFLRELLLGVDPERIGREPRVADLLELGSSRVAARLGSDPEVEVEVRLLLARGYQKLVQLEPARRELERVLQLRRAARGPDDEHSLRALEMLGSAYVDIGAEAAARRCFEEALARIRPGAPAAAELTVVAEGELGRMDAGAGDFSHAEQRLRRALELSERELGPLHGHTSECLGRLGEVLVASGRPTEAEGLLRRALEVRRKSDGATDRDTLYIEGELAELLLQLDRPDEAAPLVERVAEATERLLGPDNGATRGALARRALLLQRQGNGPAAAAAFDHIVALRRRSEGPTAEGVAGLAVQAAQCYLQAGELARAEEIIDEVLAAAETRGQTASEELVAALHVLATVYRWTDRPDECAAALDRLERLLRAPALRGNSGGYLVSYGRGTLKVNAGDPCAEEDFREAERLLLAIYPPEHAEVRLVRRSLAALLRGQGRRAEATALDGEP